MGLGSGIRKKPIPVPDPGVKKAPDPGSGFATLVGTVFIVQCKGTVSYFIAILDFALFPAVL